MCCLAKPASLWYFPINSCGCGVFFLGARFSLIWTRNQGMNSNEASNPTRQNTPSNSSIKKKNQGQKLPNTIQPLSFSPPKIICGNSLLFLFQVALGELLEMRLKEVSPSFFFLFFGSAVWPGVVVALSPTLHPKVFFLCELGGRIISISRNAQK